MTSVIRQKAVQGICAGDTFTISRRFSAEEIKQFAEISKDDNPVHSDPEFYQGKGFTAPICHGLLVAALITEVGGQIGWLATKMTFSFQKPVYADETITCRITISEVADNLFAKAKATITKNDDLIVLEGRLEGFLPKEKDRQSLQRLMDSTNPDKGQKD